MMMNPQNPIQVEVEPPWEPQVDKERLRRAVHTLLAAEQAPEAGLSLVIVGDEEMARLHQQFRNDPDTTDVLTFPYEDDESLEEMAGYLGDIIVCYEQAARQAAEEGHSTQDELDLLAVHGTLHLLGYEDEAGAEEKARMWERQAQTLDQLGLGDVAPRM
jgi:probable rRNA maturation factor